MKFNFILDKNYLLIKMLFNKNKFEKLEQWKTKNIIDENDMRAIDSLKELDIYEEYYFSHGEFEKFIAKNNLQGIVKKMMETDIFLKYYEGASDYLELVKKHWEEEKNFILEWLEKTLRKNIPKKEIPVYISHPYLNTGICIDEKYIFWGHFLGLEDLSYNNTYLCHELLHMLLPNKDYPTPAMKLYDDKVKENSWDEYWNNLSKEEQEKYGLDYKFEFDIIHTIIELTTDNELYTILSDKNKYNEGHKGAENDLRNYKNVILPYWFKYLDLSKEEIKTRTKKTKLVDVEIPDDAKTDINHFIKFCVSNEEILNKLGKNS